MSVELTTTRTYVRRGTPEYETRNQVMTQWYRKGESVERIASVFGITSKSARRLLLRQGIPKRSLYGEKHHRFKGGSIRNGYRYVRLLPDDPMVSMLDSNGYVLEHRLVMARKSGRALTANETVHHVNGDKLDNRVENLQLIAGRAHGRYLRAYCGECGSRHLVFEELPPSQ